jgi:hypothetical protein
MAKGKRLENKHQNENLEEERLRFDDQAGRGIGKLGLLQCLKEVEFTPEQIKGICCNSNSFSSLLFFNKIFYFCSSKKFY